LVLLNEFFLTKDKNKGIVGSLGIRWSLLVLDLRVDDEEGFISEGKGVVLIDDS
jgi:hypothetical protein